MSEAQAAELILLVKNLVVLVGILTGFIVIREILAGR